MTPLTDDVQ